MFIVLHQLRGDAHEAHLAGHVLPQHVAADGAHGQEGGAATVPLLQILDGSLGVLLGVHHNVLQPCAQCDFQGHSVAAVGAHQIGHRAVNAPQAATRRLHAYLYRLGKALVLLLHLRQQVDAVGEGVHVHSELHFLRRGLLRLFTAALHPQAVAIDDVPCGVGVLLGGVQQLAVLPGLPLGGG